MLQILK
jgi:hypothetical protein